VRPLRPLAWATLAGSCLLLALCGTDAAADVSKDRCVDANTAAQSLFRRGRFAETRAALQVCGDPSCPSIVVNDCVERLDQLNRAQPTLILNVKDTLGNDLTDVKLTVDGVAVAGRLGGTAVDIDPGEHTLLFEAPGRRPITRTFVLREGEKDRLEHIVLPSLPAPEPAAVDDSASSPGASADVTPPAASSGLSSRKVVALVVAGAGVAALATGTVLGLGAASAYSDQKRDCGSATSCPNHAQAVSDHSTMNVDGTWSTIAFVAGAACLAGAAWLFFAEAPATPRPATGLAVVPAIGPSGSGLILRAEF
jgi:hypothetical protein